MTFRPLAPACLALVLAAVPARSRDLPKDPAPPPNTHSIMRFTPEWYQEHVRRRAGMPVHHPSPPQAPAPGLAGVNLIANMDLTACGGAGGWNQGQCGCCWVFGSSAACSILGGIATGTPQLFSPQWFDSDYYATGGGSVCGGGDTSTFADWYNSHPSFIPWSNTNAAYADGNGNSPNTPASSIAQSPSVGVQTITATRIATDTVSQTEAIANIKAVLDANQPVTFAFFLPSQGWTDFDNAWDSDGETTPWSEWDSFSGTTSGGGHLVCCIGYDNSNNPRIMRNSWGTTSGRPNGWFEVPQALGYTNTIGNGGGSMAQFEFDTFEVVGWSGAATTPAITSQPASQTVAVGQRATFSVTASGAAPLAYQWYRGGAALASATSASYTTPAVTAADNGATFSVKVSNAYGSATSNPATLTVGTAPVVRELIVNGGFEAGTQGWTATTGLIGQFGSLEPPHGGTWEAWFGSPWLFAPGLAWQAVTLPSTLHGATLTFQLHIDVWRAKATAQNTFQAQVRDAAGKVLKVLGQFSRAQAATGYQAHSYDLTAYQGQTVRIAFQSNEAVWAGVDFVLDDVSLQVH